MDPSTHQKSSGSKRLLGPVVLALFAVTVITLFSNSLGKAMFGSNSSITTQFGNAGFFGARLFIVVLLGVMALFFLRPGKERG